MIFRIEDTDPTGLCRELKSISLSLSNGWECTFDEGVSFGGEHGPYRQSERREIYKKYVKLLLDNDKAYIAFRYSRRIGCQTGGNS